MSFRWKKRSKKMHKFVFMQDLPAEAAHLSNALAAFLPPTWSAPNPCPDLRKHGGRLAVVASDTFGASAATPALLRQVGEVQMGRSPAFEIHPGECAAVPTAANCPSARTPWSCLSRPSRFRRSDRRGSGQRAGAHMIFAGDDAKAGAVVLRPAKRCSPGYRVLAALGVTEVPVRNTRA
jgi:molybdopterin molybdotransferase